MIRSLQPQKFRISPCQGRATTGGRSRALGQRVAPCPSPAAAAARPLQARALPRAVPGRALRELRGGCLRRPGGRRREAVPQFVSNQGVRAVPRAGQQCVNKPTATPPPPRRARPAPAATAAAAGSALLAPARRAGPPPAPLAPPLPRPAPAGAGSLTYRPTRARSRTTRPARIVASREQGKGDARGPGRLPRPARPREVSGVAAFRWAGGRGRGAEGGGPRRRASLAGGRGPPGARGSQVAQADIGAGWRAARRGGRRAERGWRRGGAGRGAGEGRAPRNFLLPRGAPSSPGRGPASGAAGSRAGGRP